MTQWMMWAIAAGMVVILELFTGTFYLLMIAIGIAVGGIAAWFGLSNGIQFLVAAVVGVMATVILNRSKLGKGRGPTSARDPNVNLDIGQTIRVDLWVLQSDGSATARAAHRGAQWDIDFAGTGVPAAGTYLITEMRGSRLLVAQLPVHR